MFLWGLHSFYSACLPSDLFNELILLRNKVISFEFTGVLFLLLALYFSVFRVNFYMSDKPIPTRLCRNPYQIIKLLPVEHEPVVDEYAAP